MKFLMLNSNNQDTPAMIADEAKSFDIKMPILKDGWPRKSAEPLGVVRTAETFVIEPKTWKITLSRRAQRPADLWPREGEGGEQLRHRRAGCRTGRQADPGQPPARRRLHHRLPGPPEGLRLFQTPLTD